MMETDKEKNLLKVIESQKSDSLSPSEKLFREIGGISPDIIMEASASPSHDRRKKWIYSFGALAACLIIFIGTGLWGGGDNLETIQIDSRWNTSEGAEGEPDWAKSADELYKDVPYDENISLESMPVFKRRFYIDRDTLQYVSFDMDAMKNQLMKYMLLLGTEYDETAVILENYLGEPVEAVEDGDTAGRIYTVTDDFQISVYPDLTGIVFFSNPVSLPAEYDASNYASYEDKRQVAEYIIENYGTRLGLDNPQISLERGDYEMDGHQVYNITFYEGCSDYKENLISSNTGKVVIYTDEEGRINYIRYDPKEALENIGDYPLISPSEAAEQAKAQGASNIQKIFLGYNREMTGDEYMLPCYFVVAEYESPDECIYFDGQKDFVTYCIPAVTAEYLKRVE
ncbi:MAG: hypothetical protein ACI4LP_10850 [Anaerovoracaceae bacterium]